MRRTGRPRRPHAQSTTERGYGAAHQRVRDEWIPVVACGEAFCARCNRWIHPDEPWDLAHSPFDRGVYLGPMHRKCNRDTRLEKSLRRGGLVRADWW
jgi:hypothetical protein